MTTRLDATGASHLATSRARAARRRDTTRAVSGVRERLNSATGETLDFEQQLVALFARNQLGGFLFQIAFLIALSVALVLVAPLDLALGWSAAALITQCIVGLIVRRIMKLPEDEIEPVTWIRRIATAEFLRGVVWAALAVGTILVALPDLPGLDLLLFAALLVFIASAAMLNHHLPVTAAAATTPMAVCFAVALGLGGQIIGLMLAAGFVGAQLFFLSIAERMHRTTLAMLEAKAEKDGFIAELEQHRAIAEEARRRADAANAAKSRFLATMSHELRTPLNAILGFSEVLKSEAFGPLPSDQYREYANDIHTSGSHLLNLINEILDLSRIEAGRHELQEEAVQVAHSVEECVHLMAMKAKSKAITVNEHYQDGMPRLWADERAVRQVALNLLSNAIKFTPQGGSVSVRACATTDGGQMIEVKDTGPGIPEEEIPVVLSSFGQGSLAIKGAEQGTGLGLPIVQALVEMHGGSFHLASKLREGTTVTAYFPPERVMQAMPQVGEYPDDKSLNPRDLHERQVALKSAMTNATRAA